MLIFKNLTERGSDQNTGFLLVDCPMCGQITNDNRFPMAGYCQCKWLPANATGQADKQAALCFGRVVAYLPNPANPSRVETRFKAAVDAAEYSARYLVRV